MQEFGAMHNSFWQAQQNYDTAIERSFSVFKFYTCAKVYYAFIC